MTRAATQAPTRVPAKTDAERIMTLHPRGLRGVNIERDKYDSMRAALLRVLPKRGPGVPFKALRDLVDPHLDPSAFDAKASRTWYLTAVKQDLEARGLIEQVAGARPQRLYRC